MLRKPKKILNIVIEDYVIRIIENIGQTISALRLLEEKPLPLGLIENGKIIDEIGFYEFMTDLVKELGIKNRYVRFYVPNSLVIMREVEFPSNIKDKDLKEYFQDEIGRSIHLPFKEPVFDVHIERSHAESEDEMSFKMQSERQIGTLFAAPEEEMIKYTELFADVSLKPIAADVEALGLYRYFHYIQDTNPDKVYMFVQLNVTSINLSIFHEHQLEFLRYENLDIALKGWKMNEELEEIHWEYKEDESQLYGILDDQMLELERIMNFYQFSLKKGDKKVDEMIVLGDHPLLMHFYDRLKQQFDIPTTFLKAYLSKSMDREIGQQYIPALGLALKGGSKDAS